MGLPIRSVINRCASQYAALVVRCKVVFFLTAISQSGTPVAVRATTTDFF